MAALAGFGRVVPDDRTVILWNAATQAQVATLRGHTSEVRSVAFSSPRRRDPGFGRGVGPHGPAVGRGYTRGGGHPWKSMEVRIRSVTFSRDGVTLVSGAADGTVLLRDVETGNAAGLSGHGSLSSMALSPGWRHSWLRGIQRRPPDPAVGRGDTDNGSPPSRGTLPGSVPCRFHADGALLASGSWDRTVKLWEVRTRSTGRRPWKDTSDGVTSVSFSPDGATLASAGGWDDATVRLWDVAYSGGDRHPRRTCECRSESVAFSPPDGALPGLRPAVMKTRRSSCGTWGPEELIATLEGHKYEVNTVAFSPDGTDPRLGFRG